MSEKEPTYETAADKLVKDGYIEEAVEMLGRGYDDQPAAIIDPPRTVKALRDKGLIEYRAWGWVKMSAKFIAHLKPLKGAKLAIWQCIALSIDETGTCKMTLKEIGALTDYSHTEVISSLKELEEGGYLTINKDGKTNIYQPVFVARGEEKPKETLVKKLDSTPQYQYESSPAIENSVPSIKRVKRVNTQTSISKQELANRSIEAAIFGGMQVSQETQDKNRLAQDAVNAFESAFGITRPWSNWWGIDREWKDMLEFVSVEFKTDAQCFKRYVAWYDDKGKFGGGMNATQIKRDPALFFTAWDMFKRQDVKKSEPDRTSLLRTL